MLAIWLPLLVWLLGIPTYRYLTYRPQEGDVLFQSLPRNELVDMIEGVTQSEYSHCGVVFRGDRGWRVIESLGEVRDTSLWQWVGRGRGAGRFAAYRLRPEYSPRIPVFLTELRKLQGRPYDFDYSEDDETLYCSELIWKAYDRATGDSLGQWIELGRLNWQPYADTIPRYASGAAPLDRMLITPKALSEARQLTRVY